MVIWSHFDDIEIETVEVFQTIHLGGTDQKSVYFDQLKHWPKTGVNKRLLIDFF